MRYEPIPESRRAMFDWFNGELELPEGLGPIDDIASFVAEGISMFARGER